MVKKERRKTHTIKMERISLRMIGAGSGGENFGGGGGGGGNRIFATCADVLQAVASNFFVLKVREGF